MHRSRKPTHPGEVLREDVIKPLGLTVTEAAKRLGVTRKTLSELINCNNSVICKSDNFEKLFSIFLIRSTYHIIFISFIQAVNE